MEETKIYYFIWDSNDLDRMYRLLLSSGMNEDLIEKVMKLGLIDGTAVVPYEDGYTASFGYDYSDDPDYVLVEDVDDVDTEDEATTEETCRHCACNDCEDRLAPYEGNPDKKESKKSTEEVTEVDIDEDLDDYEVTESPDEAYENYAKVDPEYDDVLEDLRVLLHVRDEYRAVEADAISNKVEVKEGDWISWDFSILSTEDGFKIVETDYPSIFSFATEKMAQKFLDNFEEDLTDVCDDLVYLM